MMALTQSPLGIGTGVFPGEFVFVVKRSPLGNGVRPSTRSTCCPGNRAEAPPGAGACSPVRPKAEMVFKNFLLKLLNVGLLGRGF